MQRKATSQMQKNMVTKRGDETCLDTNASHILGCISPIFTGYLRLDLANSSQRASERLRTGARAAGLRRARRNFLVSRRETKKSENSRAACVVHTFHRAILNANDGHLDE